MRWLLASLWLLMALVYTFPWWLPLVAPASQNVYVTVDAAPFTLADIPALLGVLAPPLVLLALTTWYYRRSRA